jgi:hypothetical protein
MHTLQEKIRAERWHVVASCYREGRVELTKRKKRKLKGLPQLLDLLKK